MPSESSKKPAVKRRQFTAEQKAAVVRYAAKAGVVQAAAKFRVHNSAVYSWRKQFGRHEALHAAIAAERAHPSLPPDIYVLVRKLQAALKVLRASGGDLTDVEIYATLLIRALVGGK